MLTMRPLTVLARTAVLTAALACCSTALTAFSADRVESLEEPFSLRVGESARLDDTNLTLTFTGVTGDSRCPKDVVCVWAGEATVVLEAQMGDGETAKVTFKVPPGGSSTNEFQDFTLTVMELQPQTVSTKRIEATDYVAKILVVRP